MKADEFKAARKRLGLTQSELGQILNTAPQTIRKWELDPARGNTARDPNPVACQVMRWMLAGFRPPEWPEHKPHWPTNETSKITKPNPT